MLFGITLASFVLSQTVPVDPVTGDELESALDEGEDTREVPLGGRLVFNQVGVRKVEVDRSRDASWNNARPEGRSTRTNSRTYRRALRTPTCCKTLRA